MLYGRFGGQYERPRVLYCIWETPGWSEKVGIYAVKQYSIWHITDTQSLLTSFHTLSVSSALNQHLQKDIAMYKNRDPLKSLV